ncbi:MAG: hypothetical protein WC722_17825 [Rhodospirillales bacterium]|jgi:hypothetical protein
MREIAPPDIAWKRKYFRYTFEDGGRVPPRVDCYGLIMAAYDIELAIKPTEWPMLTLDAITAAGGDLLEARFTTDFVPVEMGFELPFDVAVIEKVLPVDGKLKRGPWHVGLVTGPSHLLHIDMYTGVVELAFRDTPTSKAHVTCREKHVKLFRHRQMVEQAARMQAGVAA